MSAPNPTTLRSPFVYWAQDEENISLRVDIRNAKNIKVEAKKSEFSFSATAADDEQQLYGFSLHLHGTVVAKPLEVTHHDARVEIQLCKAKKDKGFWPTLLAEGVQKPAWLKFNFDKWRDPDGDESEEEEGMRKNRYDELIRQYNAPVMTPQQAMERMRKLFNGYLCLYNVCILVAHLYVLAILLHGIAMATAAGHPQNFLNRFWRERYPSLVTCTLLQYFDVFHAWMGVTKSGWRMAAMQITGRLTVLWIIDGNPQVHSWLPTFALMLTYLAVEQFRYPYYALHSVGMDVRAITWLRYNAWLVLYPLGMALEGAIFVASIPHYYHSRNYSLEMPNALNIQFNFGVFLAVFTFTLFPFIAYTLLAHMYRQRKTRMANSAKKRI